eukprot:CAMPEP_0183561120 /NCGR_PEP_ID=MMETSP0371-20130417/96545_1 /TAXON_ID=268820 /ORGANISM="Peridinium aciculiferum, Strain PAER-2" /LENGTH=123 /DNA_ID=CAMNT_0025769547 /DNA_START=623 /DNA_END=994 /DNA_ORIENTATION=+
MNLSSAHRPQGVVVGLEGRGVQPAPEVCQRCRGAGPGAHLAPCLMKQVFLGSSLQDPPPLDEGETRSLRCGGARGRTHKQQRRVRQSQRQGINRCAKGPTVQARVLALLLQTFRCVRARLAVR